MINKKIADIQPRYGYGVHVLSVVLFTTVSYWMFSHNLSFLFYGMDGQYMMNLASKSMRWKEDALGLTGDMMQGLGSVSFPTHLKLFPGYAVEIFFSKNPVFINKVLPYVFFSLEFYLASFIVSRFIGLGWRTSIFAGWLLPLMAYPYYGLPTVYSIMSLVPQFGTVALITSITLTLYYSIGRYGSVKAILASISIVFLISYILLAAPATLVLCIPELMIMGVVFLLLCDSGEERRDKALCSLAIVTFFIVSGGVIFLHGLLKFTAAYYFAEQLMSDRMSLYRVSILYHGHTGTVLFVFAIVGAIIRLVTAARSARIIALAFLSTVIIINLAGLITTYLDFWRGPSPVVFEVLLWPFYTAFSVFLINAMFDFLVNFKEAIIYPFFGRFWLVVKLNMLILTIFILYLGYHHQILEMPTRQMPEQIIPMPPVKTEIVNILENKISIRDGRIFRGRVANFTGAKIQQNINWFDLLNLDAVMIKNFGNEHRMNGLWYYDIPTLDIYSPLISPYYFQFAKYILSKQSDQQMRNIVVLRNLNLRWLKAIGVKYIVSDTPLPADAIFVSKIVSNNMEPVYLYELVDANSGQYSPTNVIVLNGNKQILKQLLTKRFDPKNDVVLNQHVYKKLSNVLNASMTIHSDYVRVRASTLGASLLLLPIEFSNCLYVVPVNKNNKDIVLLRANLVQTGIYFQGHLDVKLRYFNGPFSNSKCRLQDAKSFEVDNAS